MEFTMQCSVRYVLLACIAAAFSAQAVRSQATVTTAETITLPTLMFRVEKQEVGYYGPLKGQFASVPIRYPSWKEIHTIFYHSNPGINIYADFERRHRHVPLLPYGHSGVSPSTYTWVKQLLGRSPRFMVEVGSFVGNSAATFGQALRAENNSAVLLCIDTWDCDGNMWLSPELVPTMHIRGGQPHIFEQFMQRIITAGVNDTVLPWRVASTVGARYLHVLRTHIDVLFLDSAHELGETFVELMLWWQTLQPGSVIFGDDYNWGGVSHDVQLFLKLHPHLQLEFTEDKRFWAIRVPGTYVQPQELTQQTVVPS